MPEPRNENGPPAEWLAAWLDGFECGSGIVGDQSIIEFATERWADQSGRSRGSDV